VPVTDELLANNAAYARYFTSGDLPMPPGKKVAVLACMDARLNVYGALGLREADAHVIRNAGGVVSDDAIRSLMISQRLLGTQEAAPLARVAELLRVDLADVTDAAERVAPYITADGRRLWSVKLIERAIDPNAPAWLRRRAGAPPKTPPSLAG
jgi:hypothetical protein